MDHNELNNANERLQQNDTISSKKKLWIIIGIVMGIVIIVVLLVFWYVKRSIDNSDTYPYIPTPRNTIKSSSFPELLMNILMDINDTEIKYSVISRSDIIERS